MMVANNVILEPTSYIFKSFYGNDIDPSEKEKMDMVWDERKRNFEIFLNKGVKISFASDAGCPHIRQGDNAKELTACVELGMSTMDTIVAATKTASEAIGIDNITGTLENGKMADIILVDGDPLKDISILLEEEKIKMVMKEGEVIITR
jgi:imidazolonepropionase-like amidohydrolase